MAEYELKLRGESYRSVAADWCGSPAKRRESAMIYERITAWMLVAVYYTVFLGVIVLGLRGAL